MSFLINQYQRNNSFFIAEVGSAHMGDIDKAIFIIDQFRQRGVNIFKFQHIIASEILHARTGELNLLGEKVDLYQSFLKLEQDENFFKKIKDYCVHNKLLFFASAFGIKSTKDLLNIGSDIFKVASPESNYTQLLKYFNKYGKNVFLSSGVTKLKDIENSFSHLDKEKTSLLHCVTQYPALEEEMNLLLMPTLKNHFHTLVGLSDHSLDPFFSPEIAMILSRFLGQTFILEKHVTLDKGGKGLDDKISLLPEEAQELNERFAIINAKIKKEVSFLKEVNPRDGFTKEKKKELLSRVLDVVSYDAQRVDRVLGDGVKRLSKGEESIYKTTNRSYCATRFIKKGELITNENIGFLRCERNLDPGLNYEYDHILGRARAKRDVDDGDPIILPHLEL